MVRREDTAGKRHGPRGRRRAGARLGALAVLVVLLPAAFAAPAAGAAEYAVAEGAAGVERVEGQRAWAAGLSHRHYYSTWRDARTYWSQESRYPTGGWLWAGRHFFFCQVEGEPHSDGEGYSTWWALTDDHTGNQDVFVSATAFRVHEPWQPIEGLPRC